MPLSFQKTQPHQQQYRHLGFCFPSEFSRLRDSLQNASANHAFLSFAIKLMTSPLPTELQNQLGYNSHNTGRWEKYELFQAHF